MRKKSKLLIALVLVLIPIVAVGYRYFHSEKNRTVDGSTLTVDGDFTEATIQGNEALVPGDTMCSDVKLRVTSTADSLLRAKVSAVYALPEGKAPVDDAVIINATTDWIKVDDYYYYNGVVNSQNGSEIPFIESVIFDGTNDYQGIDINLLLEMELIQKEHNAYIQVWGITETDESFSFLREL